MNSRFSEKNPSITFIPNGSDEIPMTLTLDECLNLIQEGVVGAAPGLSYHHQEDLIQESMYRLLAKGNPMMLKNPDTAFNPRGFIVRIGQNVTMAAQRLKNAKLTTVGAEVNQARGESNILFARNSTLDDPHEVAVHTALHAKLPDIFATLPPDFGNVLQMRLAGHDKASIAKHFGIHEKTVDTRIYRARALLRGKLAAKGWLDNRGDL